MSRESAIRIFGEQRFAKPEWAVDIITEATSLSSLDDLMGREKTYLDSTQFVANRISQLYEGDHLFKQQTIVNAKKTFDYVPQEVVDYYISKGGGIDMQLATSGQIELGNLPLVESTKLDTFYLEANTYLFNALRTYVTDSIPAK